MNRVFIPLSFPNTLQPVNFNLYVPCPEIPDRPSIELSSSLNFTRVFSLTREGAREKRWLKFKLIYHHTQRLMVN